MKVQHIAESVVNLSSVELLSSLDTKEQLESILGEGDRHWEDSFLEEEEEDRFFELCFFFSCRDKQDAVHGSMKIKEFTKDISSPESGWK